MPWWFWVLVWAVLVLALLGMLAAIGWRLFKKTMTALEALGELTAKLEILDAARKTLAEERFRPAVSRPISEIQAEYRENAEGRDDRRRFRKDRRRTRGKLLVSADLRQRTFPWDSSVTPSRDGT
jgi:hypothetical protein